ncbi:DUF3040 domain-containing protein [Arsenicicoccus dermatophilus]|uniref:DUF3040 domain-containing protein n=1 Tax=Arsenicicoccus dermatophilus TaxID=1076331 RepID=UPI001F4D2B6A|nr:DUF3040 domain-containing protein [Arsenicicoccus dermatophilus]MCH8612638.1 DUF3040 domain-containing protein [Arsenicicoccus dermatophilus]
MPLSEREQALLEQMEQALMAEDPQLAAQLANASRPRASRTRVVLGLLGVLAGLGVVLLGVVQQQVALGILGFLIMVACAVYAFAAPRRPALGTVQEDGTVAAARPRRTGAGRSPGRGGAAIPRRQGTFMQRMEQRWEARRERGEI